MWESHGIHTRLYYKVGGCPVYIPLMLMFKVTVEQAKKLSRYNNITDSIRNYGIEYCIDYDNRSMEKSNKNPLVKLMYNIMKSNLNL